MQANESLGPEAPAAARVALIGPAKSGKTTVGNALAQKLGVPFRTLDVVGLARASAAFDKTEADRAREDGPTASYGYLLPLGLEPLLAGLSEPGPGVVEVSGWFPDPSEGGRFAPVAAALGGYDHVVLLTPLGDVDDALAVVGDRMWPQIDGLPLDAYFLKHPANRVLAKQVVYRNGRTPLETRDDILAAIDKERAPVVLIGPMGAGKSTQGGLVAEALGRRRVAMDEVRWDYYKEIGWSHETQEERSTAEGFAGVYAYWKAFEIHAVERILADHPDAVIDFGAGHSLYDEPAHMARAQAALGPVANVVLLLPSADEAVSLAELRKGASVQVNGVDANRVFLTAPEIGALASSVVVVGGRSAAAVSEEIIAAIRA